MPAPEAARYIGVSEGTLRKLPIPPRSVPDVRRVVYDRLDLDKWADALAQRTEAGGNTCDAVWD